MKQKLKSLRLRMLMPVIAMTLFVVILLTGLFSRAYSNMILQQEREVNAVGFETVVHSVEPLVSTSVGIARSIVSDERVASYAGLRFDSLAELVHARMRCRDYLHAEILKHDGIFGLLFMRKDGSLFGALPEGNLFYDDPAQNPLPEDVQSQILNAQLGQTVWAGPVSGSLLYGFENDDMPKSVMIGAGKTMDVRYGECYMLVLMDESIFDDLFAALKNDKGSWHLFAENEAEICHTGTENCTDPDRLIRESNQGTIFSDENGRSVSAFSMKMETPPWTLVREVSMEDYEKVIRDVRRGVILLAGVVFLVALAIYELWLKKFMQQFRKLQNGIVRMGKGELKPLESAPFSIGEFEVFHQEIDRTSLALNQQMETIRRMERERVELENEKKEKKRIEQELNLAREIQENALPRIFPPFPGRTEFSLYASMTPAREVGGDFYDFFLIDSDHLALVIADVSGKGIPAALFMMVSKTLIKNQLTAGCDPAETLEMVNRQLSERNRSRMFVTVWLAVLEISTGRGLACNAGHENPGLRRADGEFELLKYKHNMLVGVSPKARYQNREFELHPGDCIFVYTDGVPEANSRDNGMFGTERLVGTLNSCKDGSPEEIIRGVRSAVDAFVGDAEQYDDLTMLCLSYTGPADEKTVNQNWDETVGF